MNRIVWGLIVILFLLFIAFPNFYRLVFYNEKHGRGFSSDIGIRIKVGIFLSILLFVLFSTRVFSFS